MENATIFPDPAWWGRAVTQLQLDELAASIEEAGRQGPLGTDALHVEVLEARLGQLAQSPRLRALGHQGPRQADVPEQVDVLQVGRPRQRCEYVRQVALRAPATPLALLFPFTSLSLFCPTLLLFGTQVRTFNGFLEVQPRRLSERLRTFRLPRQCPSSKRRHNSGAHRGRATLVPVV